MDLSTLASLGGLANVLYDQSKYEEAEGLNRQALSDIEENSGQKSMI